ncbi:hypothetical protein JY441_13690 [Stenotrophomonas maltophilia]|nr:hypothetical protein [Stenotrophomonas maltophilia]
MEHAIQQQGRACEARHWIRQGYNSGRWVDELITRIAGKRGAAAAEALREEMRRQWLRRREWMEVSEL